MCDECGMWRLVYSKRKLNTDEREHLDSALSGLSFSCGSPLQEAPIPEDLTDVVYVKKLRCHDRVETLYYSTNSADVICVYCSVDLPPSESDQDQRKTSITGQPQLSAERTSIIDHDFMDYYAFIRKIYKGDAELRLCSKNESEVLDSFEEPRQA